MTVDVQPWTPAAAVAIAAAGDVLFGDPPNRMHPVAWMGQAIALGSRPAPREGRTAPLLWGFALVVIGSASMASLGWLIETQFSRLSWTVAALGQAVVLSSCLSIRSLSRAAGEVLDALNRGDVAAARQAVAFHLVSRDVAQLQPPELSAAAIESVAENSSDSVVAPLFYFAVAGLPGVLVYRFVNTCDAMLGYRTMRLQWLGKPAARADDLLNLVPARLTAAIMLLLVAPWPRLFRRAAAVWRRDRDAVASPNAGHPMSVAAGALGVVLEKRGVYVLGRGQCLPSAFDLQRAIGLLWATSAVFVLLLCLVLGLRGLW